MLRERQNMPIVSFNEQVAIVTGAGSGIGRATALLLATRGARVLVNDPGLQTGANSQSVSRAVSVAREIIDAGGCAVADTVAVGSRDAASQIIDATLAAFGRVDILINNAGIARPGEFDGVSDRDIDEVMTVNLHGPYALMRAVWPRMRAQAYGRIVNLVSSALLGSGISGPYAVSKGGLLSLTKEAGIAGRALGILCNAVMPSAHTPLIDKHPDPAYRAWMRRHLPPEKVAALVAFLASREAACSGEILAAGGGRASRVTFLESAGYVDIDLTAEAVREHFAMICNVDGGTILETQSDHQNNYLKCFPN